MVKYHKAANAYTKGSNSVNYFVYYDNQEIPVGSDKYNKLIKQYSIEEGRFKLDLPEIRKRVGGVFDHKLLIINHQDNKELLPDIILDPNKKTVFNPFTGGYLRKNSKNYQKLMMIYQEEGDKLVPRDEPTHVVYKDKGGKKRLTTRGSKKFNELEKQENLVFNPVGNSFSDVDEKVKANKLLNGNLVDLKIGAPVENFALHSNNQSAIISLLRNSMFPRLIKGGMIKMFANIYVKGTQFNYVHKYRFMEYFFDGDLDKLVDKLMESISKFDSKIFNSEDYTGYLSSFSILIFPAPAEIGGCAIGDRLRIDDPDDPSIKLVSYGVKANSNNCLLAILKRTSPKFNKSRKQFNTIRKELGIELGTLIDYRDILELGMPDYFELSICLEFDGDIYWFGDYPNKVDIKLMDNHYYHVLRKKQLNRSECLTSFKINKIDDTSFENNVIQPRVTNVYKTDLDPKWVVHLAPNNDIDSELQWRYDNQINYGSCDQLIDFLLSLNDQLHQNDDLHYESINKKLIPKNLLVHCFEGSRQLFGQIEAHLKEKEVKTKYFFRSGMMQVLNLEDITFFDVCVVFDNENYSNLKKDVELMNNGEYKEVFDIIQAHFFRSFNVHINDYVSLPGLGEQVWKSMVKFKKGQEIYLPEKDQIPFIMRSLKGARNYPLKHNYQSSYLNDVLQASNNKERLEVLEKIKKDQDYLFYLDSFSCYPGSMTRFEFPSGKPYWLPREILKILNKSLTSDEFELDECGLYEISFTPPSGLRTPILIKQDESKKLLYDLLPGTGVYNHLEINLALKHGYQIHNIYQALIWPETCETYFTDYMKKVVQLKMSNSSIKKRIGKLLMNSLYGRFLYHNGFSKPVKCNTLKDVHKYLEKNVIYDYETIGDSLKLFGVAKDLKSKSPIHLASFVLSYSKMIMMDLITTIDPELKLGNYYYTDNDSLFIPGKLVKLLTDQGKMVDYQNGDWFNQLGKGKNDIKDGECIIEAIFLKPKIYYYTYLNDKGEIKHMIKAAGVPRNYSLNNQQTMIDTFFKKEETIIAEIKDGEKTFKSSKWSGMNFINGEWYPNGF